jgi:hypothetical protein
MCPEEDRPGAWDMYVPLSWILVYQSLQMHLPIRFLWILLTFPRACARWGYICLPILSLLCVRAPSRRLRRPFRVSSISVVFPGPRAPYVPPLVLPIRPLLGPYVRLSIIFAGLPGFASGLLALHLECVSVLPLPYRHQGQDLKNYFQAMLR